ncbi:MAG: hypothetical protein M1269_07540 [Chloroflexi bacterium]|nr:hypothetical protein [Chloroflexota bacterium]
MIPAIALIIAIYATVRLIEIPFKPGHPTIVRIFFAVLSGIAILLIWLVASSVVLSGMNTP